MKQRVLQSVANFCDHYGFARGTIYQMIRHRRIPVVRTGVKGHGIKLDPEKVLAVLEQPAEPADMALKRTAGDAA